MYARLSRLLLVATALLVGVFASAAPSEPKPADAADDPLPEGAKARFGIARPILRGNPAVGLVGPKYADFVVPTTTGGIRRYNLGTGRPLNAGSVTSGQAVVSADGTRAAVVRPGGITVVDVATGKLILAVKPPDGVLIVGTPGVSLSGDGKALAYGGRSKDGKGEVVVWDVDKNAALARVETAQTAPVFPTLSLDGSTLVSHGAPLPAPTVREPNPPGTPLPKEPVVVDSDAARTAQVWSVESGEELFKARVTGMGGVVVAAAFAADGSFVALSAGDGPVDLFDVKTGKRTQTLLGRKGQGVKVAISPDGKTVASVGPDYRVQRWSSDGKAIGVSEPPPGMLVAQISGLVFADNDRVIGWLTANQFAAAWEAPSGRLLGPLSEHMGAVRSIAIPDEKDLYTSGVEGRLFRWELATGQPNEAINLHPARLPAQPLVRPVVTLSADATRATSLRTPAEVFDLADGRDLFCIPSPSAAPAANSLFFSPDGMKVITACRPADGKRAGACVVWDLTTERRVIEVELPPSTAVPSAAINRDGTRLVVLTHARDATTGMPAVLVTGWDLKTGKKLGEVQDSTAAGAVYLSAAGDTSAVLAAQTGRLWSVNYTTGEVGKDIDKLPIKGGEIPVYGAVTFSPDGKRFATGAPGDRVETYGVRVYDWPSGKALHTFVGHVAAVSSMRFTADGKFLASGSQDTSVLLWDLSKIPAPK